MGDLSNKSLAVFLLAAMVVSLGGAFLVLNKLGSEGITGYATSGTGKVNISIQSNLSITMVDDIVEFGLCYPASGAHTNITTEDTLNTTTVCPDFTADDIDVRNNGNVNATVTMNVSKVGKLDNTTAPTSQILLNSTTAVSSFWYKTTSSGESPYTGGCPGGVVSSYTVLKEVGRSYSACNSLLFGATNNSIGVEFLITVPYDAPVGADSVNVQFNAAQS